ncbi:hypothetical protein P3T37_006964 [Kitasatospora sp. MAA4]|uniref:DinB family protein n=1 Tax=Kitasatospora sp. MAA4 TaxID=3035093 RepID=UPI0024762B8B|nr:DinB family protein [Kitasatospora sp. MAA4]MDH6137531.1 hypothetical protein [Kitasatospora sp. MAA4]
MTTPESATAEIVPDTKDWTWVLERACPACGFDTPGVSATEVAALVRAKADAWAALLAGDDAALRRRPDPVVWSPLEYACHVRDVFRICKQRLELMLSQDDPSFANWDQDATAVAERYGEQDPTAVRADLLAAAQLLAAGFDQVTGDQWQRTGARSDGARFTVASFARYLIHDPVHHLHDVTAVTAATAVPAG